MLQSFYYLKNLVLSHLLLCWTLPFSFCFLKRVSAFSHWFRPLRQLPIWKVVYWGRWRVKHCLALGHSNDQGKRGPTYYKEAMAQVNPSIFLPQIMTSGQYYLTFIKLLQFQHSQVYIQCVMMMPEHQRTPTHIIVCSLCGSPRVSACHVLFHFIHTNPCWEGLSSSSFYRWGNWGFKDERLMLNHIASKKKSWSTNPGLSDSFLVL